MDARNKVKETGTTCWPFPFINVGKAPKIVLIFEHQGNPHGEKRVTCRNILVSNGWLTR